MASYRFGNVAIAHNGNIVNFKALRESLEETGSIFNTSSDTEVGLAAAAQASILHGHVFTNAVAHVRDVSDGRAIPAAACNWVG
jgi:glutamine phosphoribosylpyrophosphate amidotransferase